MLTLFIACLLQLQSAPIALAEDKAVWAKDSIDKLLRSCDSDTNVAYNRVFTSSKYDLVGKMRDESGDSLDKRLQKNGVDSFLDYALHVFPHTLPEDFSGKKTFAECGIALRKLHESSLRSKSNPKAAQEALKTWKNCLAMDSEDVSETQKLLTACYEKRIK